MNTILYKVRKILKDEIFSTLLVYAMLSITIIITFNYVIMLNLIPSGSMENTIMTGDLVIATRYDKTNINRYDIMVFIPPDDTSSYYIKRVIGLPGETIVVEDGKVYADGVELDDSFIPEEMKTSGDGTYEVPEGCYFMLGDNRNHSLDARFWKEKYVPIENMVAKARVIIFPFSDVGSLKYKGEE
jgi:signal peptidase I